MESRIIIKADDFSISSNINNWIKLFEIVKHYNAYIDVGYLALVVRDKKIFDIEYQKKFFEPFSNLLTDNINFFLHGIEHRSDEYLIDNKSVLLQKYELNARFLKIIFDRDFIGFGAPYNNFSNAAVETWMQYSDAPFYYADRFGFKSLDRNIPFSLHCSIERKDCKYNPDFDYFRRLCTKEIYLNKDYVIQIHPDRWNSDGFEAFDKILRYLYRLECNFCSTKGYIDYVARKNMDATKNDYFSNRYSYENLSFQRIKLEKIKSFFPDKFKLCKFCDIGSGCGEWSYLASKFTSAEIISIEHNKDLYEKQNSYFKKYNSKNIKSINTDFLSITDNQDVNNIDFSVCNRVLMYMGLIPYLEKLSKISNVDSYHFLSYQGPGFYVMGLLDFLNKDNIDMASRRIKVIKNSLNFYHSKSNTPEYSVPLNDLISVFMLYGFVLSGIISEESTFVENLIFNYNPDIAKFSHITLCHKGLYDEVCNRKTVFFRDDKQTKLIPFLENLVMLFESRKFEECKKYINSFSTNNVGIHI